MLKLPNFDHMNTFTMKFKSRCKNFLGDVMDRNYDVMNFISKYLYFKKQPRKNIFISGSKLSLF